MLLNIHIPDCESFRPVADSLLNGTPLDSVTVGPEPTAQKYKIVRAVNGMPIDLRWIPTQAQHPGRNPRGERLKSQLNTIFFESGLKKSLLQAKRQAKQITAEHLEQQYADVSQDSDAAKAASKIQSAFRGYRIRPVGLQATRVDAASKKNIEQHMLWIHKQFPYSGSADMENGRTERRVSPSTAAKFQQYGQARKALAAHPGNARAYALTLERYVDMLSSAVRDESLVCDDMARLVALKIRNDPSLPEALRKETRVCRMGGHIMCCVGDPKVSTSLIVDPWIYYLDLHPAPGYRDQMVWAKMRERGFLGTVAQYHQFIFQHPNRYVNSACGLGVDALGQYVVENMSSQHIEQINKKLPVGEELKLMAH